MTTPSPQSLNSAKRVSFDTLVVPHDTLHIFDFTETERQEYWLTDLEKAQIRCEAKRIARKISTRQHLSDQVCTRGLEAHCMEQAQVRHKIRRRAQQAVFDEQYLQRTQGFTNEVRIAATYQELASKCQLKAQRIGFTDQIECEALDFQTRKTNCITTPRSPFARGESLRRLSLRLFRSVTDSSK
jgi:hypothetical protein